MARGEKIKVKGYGSKRKRAGKTNPKTNGRTFALHELETIKVKDLDRELTGADLKRIIDALGFTLDEFAEVMKFGSKSYFSILTKSPSKPLTIDIKVRLARLGAINVLDKLDK